MIGDALPKELVTKLEALTISNGDLIVVQTAENVIFDQNAYNALCRWLEARGIEDVRILNLGPAPSAVLIDGEVETLLNDKGYYKHDPCVVCDSHPAPVIKWREDDTGTGSLVYYCVDCYKAVGVGP